MRSTAVARASGLLVLLALLGACTSQDSPDAVNETVDDSATEVVEETTEVLDETVAEPSDVAGAASEAAEAVEDLASQLRAEGGFDTFLSGLSVAGLEDVVRGGAPATLFVPGDDVFLGSSSQMQALLQDPERVDDVLRHHAVEGTYSLDELREVDELTTVDGATVPVSTEGDQVLVDGVAVTGPTYRSGQVVAHVVEGILDPEQR